MTETKDELTDKAYGLVAHLFDIERDRLDTRATLMDIAEKLVQDHNASLVEAAGICGVTRQALSTELRIRALMARTRPEA